MKTETLVVIFPALVSLTGYLTYRRQKRLAAQRARKRLAWLLEAAPNRRNWPKAGFFPAADAFPRGVSSSAPLGGQEMLRVVSLLLVVMLASSGCSADGERQRRAFREAFPAIEKPVIGTRVGDMAPDMVLNFADGSARRLSHFRGKVVVLSWSSFSCAPCRREIPDENLLQQELGDRGLQLLDVAPEEEKGKDSGRRFPMVLDFSGMLMEKWNIDVYKGATMPFFVIIDRRGFVRYRSTTWMRMNLKTTEARNLRPLIDKLLTL